MRSLHIRSGFEFDSLRTTDQHFTTDNGEGKIVNTVFLRERITATVSSVIQNTADYEQIGLYSLDVWDVYRTTRGVGIKLL